MIIMGDREKANIWVEFIDNFLPISEFTKYLRLSEGECKKLFLEGKKINDSYGRKYSNNNRP